MYVFLNNVHICKSVDMYKQMLGAHKVQSNQSYMRKPFYLSVRNHTLVLSKPALEQWAISSPIPLFPYKKYYVIYFP